MEFINILKNSMIDLYKLSPSTLIALLHESFPRVSLRHNVKIFMIYEIAFLVTCFISPLSSWMTTKALKGFTFGGIREDVALTLFLHNGTTNFWVFPNSKYFMSSCFSNYLKTHLATNVLEKVYLELSLEITSRINHDIFLKKLCMVIKHPC